MGIGDLAEIMTQCLDAFPESRADYTDDKMAAKRRLQEPMRRLKREMEKPNIFPALLNKSFFNGGEVDYLSVLPRELPNTLPVGEKHFHIFDQRDVVRLLTEHLEIRNSKANNPTQMDDQKVIFRYGRNVGEIEIRTDSDRHYREVKWRMNAESIFKILAAHLESDSQSYK